MKNLALLAVTAISLSACASIVQGSHQRVNLGSNMQSTGQCTLVDAKGHTYTTSVPGSVDVSRGDGPLKVNCTVQSAEGQKVVEETLEPWTLGNVLLGGVIGLGVDSYTGAYQKYPDDITISFVNVQQNSDAVHSPYGVAPASGDASKPTDQK